MQPLHHDHGGTGHGSLQRPERAARHPQPLSPWRGWGGLLRPEPGGPERGVDRGGQRDRGAGTGAPACLPQRRPQKTRAGVRGSRAPGAGSGDLLVRGRRRRAPARLPAGPAPAHQPRHQKHTGPAPLYPELHPGAARALQHQRQEAGRWPPLPLAAPAVAGG